MSCKYNRFVSKIQDHIRVSLTTLLNKISVVLQIEPCLTVVTMQGMLRLPSSIDETAMEIRYKALVDKTALFDLKAIPERPRTNG